MSERKIILEEILHSKSDTKTLSEEFVYHEFQIIQAMKEACKQVLVLASENVDNIIENSEEEVSELSCTINNSILDTIRSVV